MNPFNQDLAGKTVVIHPVHLPGASEAERTFVCEDGFGCRTFTLGRSIYGFFPHDGSKARIDCDMIEKVLEPTAPATERAPS